MTAAPAPDVFMPYQQRFMAAIEQNSVVVEEKSRRTGFSWAAACVATLTASATREAGGQDVLYMGYNLEITREFIDYVADWSKQMLPIAAAVQEYLFTDPDHPEREIKAFRVEFASGFKALALPSVPRALRGMQGLAIIDEAAFHDDLPELLKAAFALLIWGGKVVVISTHNGEANPFNQLVQDIRAGRKPYYLGRTTFDDAIADGLYRRVCLRTGETWTAEGEAAWRAKIISEYGEAADEELHVIPSAGSGTAIPGILIEARAAADIPVLRYACTAAFSAWPDDLREAETLDWCREHLAPLLAKLDPTEPHVLGEDFGRSGDLSVQWPLAIGRDLVRRTPFIVELHNVPFRQQEQILYFICDRLPRFRAAKLDARGNGQYLAERAAQKYGSRIEQVMLSEGWYRDNMPAFKAAFEDATIVIPRNRGVSDDLRALKMIRGIIRLPDGNTSTGGDQRHGDAAIAGALAYAASRAEPESYGYQSIIRPNRGGGSSAIDDDDMPARGALRGRILA